MHVWLNVPLRSKLGGAMAKYVPLRGTILRTIGTYGENPMEKRGCGKGWLDKGGFSGGALLGETATPASGPRPLPFPPAPDPAVRPSIPRRVHSVAAQRRVSRRPACRLHRPCAKKAQFHTLTGGGGRPCRPVRRYYSTIPQLFLRRGSDSAPHVLAGPAHSLGVRTVSVGPWGYQGCVWRSPGGTTKLRHGFQLIWGG
eukprot:gene14152-biopygen14155